MFFLPRALAEHPLQEAKKNKWDDYFKKLAASRYSVDDASPKNGWTALHFAARDAASAQVSQLIRKGAEVDKRCAKGKSPLMMAVRKKNGDTTQCLINHGADVNFKDANGDSPLHMAVEAGSTELLSVLAKDGANLNQVNTIGWTALHKAALLHRVDEAICLIDLGADIHLRTNNGTLASEVAGNSGCIKLAQMLGLKEKTGITESNRSDTFDSNRELSSSMLRTLSKRTTVSDTHRVGIAIPIAPEGENAAARAVLTEELKAIFEGINQTHLLPAAVMWCLQQGAENLNDVMEDESCVEDLADLLNMPRLKRSKFITRMTPPSRMEQLPL